MGVNVDSRAGCGGKCRYVDSRAGYGVNVNSRAECGVNSDSRAGFGGKCSQQGRVWGLM